MMQRVFKGKLSTKDDIALKYKDEGKDNPLNYLVDI